jgi:hypothetical protein
VVFRSDFSSPLAPPYDSVTRTIRPAYGAFRAPWQPNQRVAVAVQVPQPGPWGEGLQVASGPQKFGFEVSLGGSASAVVDKLADGSSGFEVDWQAPRDFSLDVQVAAVDGQWRLVVSQVWPPRP